MRGIGAGKTRLAAMLDNTERARLNRQLLVRTVAVIAGSGIPTRQCVVVSGCARALRIAGDAGISTLREPRPRRGLNAAVRHAVDTARRQGARRILILPADLPLLSRRVVGRLVIRRWDGRRLTLAPDRAGEGTNALLLARRGISDFFFGADSFSKHCALVTPAALSVCRIPELMLDIDTAADLGRARGVSNGI